MKTIDATKILLPLLAAATSTAPAIAGDRADAAVQAVMVRHVDRDPATDAAARTILARLDRAAIDACGGSSFSLRETKEALRAAPCWNDAMTQAVSQIGSRRLRDVFQQRYRAGGHHAG